MTRRLRPAGPGTPASMRRPTGRRACRAGSPTRSVLRSGDAGRAAGAARAGRALLHRRRRGPRLRPDVHHPRLAAVGRVPRVVVEQLAAAVDLALDARRLRGGAALLDGGLADGGRRGGRGGGGGPLPGGGRPPSWGGPGCRTRRGG